MKEIENPVLPPGASLPVDPKEERKKKQAEAKAKKAEEKRKRREMMFRPQVSKVQVRYDFTKEETLTFGAELSRLHQERDELENQQKAIVKDFGSRIDAKKVDASIASNKIANGYEMRETEALVFFRKAEKKRLLYKLDGTFIYTEDMRPADFQELFLPELDPKVKEGDKLPKKLLDVVLVNVKRK